MQVRIGTRARVLDGRSGRIDTFWGTVKVTKLDPDSNLVRVERRDGKHGWVHRDSLVPAKGKVGGSVRGTMCSKAFGCGLGFSPADHRVGWRAAAASAVESAVNVTRAVQRGDCKAAFDSYVAMMKHEAAANTHHHATESHAALPRGAEVAWAVANFKAGCTVTEAKAQSAMNGLGDVRAPRRGEKMVCRPYVTLRNGKTVPATKYGPRAFCFPAKGR